MAITARPAASFEATITGAPSGLVGTLGVQITDNIGGVSVARTTAGIVEFPSGSGLYGKTMTAPTVAGQYTILWDTGTITPTTTAAEALTVTASLVAGPPTTYYCLPDDLRAELAVDSTALTDGKAVKLIQTAEDITDGLLGGWIPQTGTGRKITVDFVEAWQWAKLQRFTVLLAAKLYANPTMIDGRQWKAESGPDFSASGPIGSLIPPVYLQLLNDSGLRQLAGRANNHFGRPLVDRFFNYGRDNGAYRY